MDIQVLIPPKTPKLMGKHPQTHQQKGKCPHNILISLKHTNAQGSQQLSMGGANEGGTKWSPLQPTQHAKPLRTYKCRAV